MGKLINFDEAKKRYLLKSNFGMIFNKDFHKTINSIPIVEVIPNDQYEARLKADMVAMLTELQLEIDELPNHELQSSDWKQGFTHGLADVQEKVIQKKINELKEKDNGK